MSGELRGEMARALETGSLAVVALAFLAVGREGVETALFMVGYAEAETPWPLIGLIVGVLVAAAIAYGMYRGAVRINLAKFFKYTGVFLIVVAAGILSYGIGALQTVGWLPGLSAKAFDISPGSTGRPGTARSSRASSTSRRRPPCCSSLLAGLPRRRAGAVPAPDKGAPCDNPIPDPEPERRPRNLERSTT